MKTGKICFFIIWEEICIYAYLVLGDKLEYLSEDKKMTKQSKYIRLHAVSLSQPEPSLSLSGSEEATYSGPKIPTFIIPFPISETHFFHFYIFLESQTIGDFAPFFSMICF